MTILQIVAPPLPELYKTPSAPSGSRITRMFFCWLTVTSTDKYTIFCAAPHPSGHRTLLPVGPAYLNHLRLTLHHAHSFSALDKHLEAERDRLFALNGDASAAEDDLGVGDEEESPELLSLDPKEWKVTSFLL